MASLDFEKIEKYAEKCYADANCKYGEGSYMVHIRMVLDFVLKNVAVFKTIDDANATVGAAFVHDAIEDAKQTYNNIKEACGKQVADVALKVTDVPAENRLMRHLLTMPKTVQDYRAIILKMADMYCNASYSKRTGSGMYKKYVAEYAYRKPIFQMALTWYVDDLNQPELKKMWDLLDEVHSN